MKTTKYFALLLLIPLVAFTMHKYYISLCEIEYVEEQKSIQITLGMFIDDIELTLNKNHQSRLNLATELELKSIDKHYEEYLNKHFIISINKELKTYNYIGKEYEDDIVRFYLEVTNIEQLKSLEISNTSLFRDFKDQKNIIKIKAFNKHKTLYLTRENDKKLLNF